MLPRVSAVYDLTLLWATAVNRVTTQGGDPTNKTQVLDAFYTLNTLPSQLISTPQNYSVVDGHRKGPIDLMNFQTIRVNTTNTQRWLKVGSWIGAVTSGGSSVLTVNSSLLQFASGTAEIPPTKVPNTIRIGFIGTCTLKLIGSVL